MATNATLTIDGDAFGARAWNQYFEPIVERSEDVRPIWGAVKAAFFDIEQTLFDNEGATDEHKPWKELSESYLEWKDRVAPSDPILQLGGATSRNYELIKELTGEGPYGEVASRQEWVYSTKAQVMEEGPTGEKERMYLATIHMLGLPQRHLPMPSRPPIRLTEGNRWRIANIIVDYVITGETDAS